MRRHNIHNNVDPSHHQTGVKEEELFAAVAARNNSSNAFVVCAFGMMSFLIYGTNLHFLNTPPTSLSAQQYFLRGSERTGNEYSLKWLHVPKTGSSFFYSLLQYDCPRFPNKKSFVNEVKRHESGQALLRCTVRAGRSAERERGSKFWNCACIFRGIVEVRNAYP